MKKVGALCVTCMLSLLMMAPPAYSQTTEKFQQGIDAFAIGDYQTAANIWLVEAYEGSRDAQFNLGVMYIEGKGVAQNRDDAFFWFTKAAENGHIQAQYNLGHLYFEDKDNPEALAKGVAWWRKSSLQGFGIAQYNYARALFYGIGAEQNLPESKFWMEQSAESGEEVALRFLEKHKGTYAGVVAQIDQPQDAAAPEPTEGIADAGSGVNVAVVEDRPLIQSSIPEQSAIAPGQYVSLNDMDAKVHVRADSLSAVLAPSQPDLQLRAISIQDNWIEVRAPGGFPVWVESSNASIQGRLIEITGDTPKLYSVPRSDAGSGYIGIIPAGNRLLLLTEQDGWYRVLAPEEFTGWVERDRVTEASGTSTDLAMQWQNQTVQRKSGIFLGEDLISTEDSSVIADSAVVQAEETVINNEPEVETAEAATLPESNAAATAVAVDQTIEEGYESLTVDEFVAQLENSLEISVEMTAESVVIPGDGGLPEEDPAQEYLESNQYLAQFALEQLDDFTPIELNLGDGSSIGVAQGSGVHNDNQWLYSRNPAHFTLQLFSIRDRDKALVLYEKVKNGGHLFSTVSEGTRWYFILLGDFENEAVAEVRLQELPKWARLGAVKSFSTLQRKRCEKYNLLENYERMLLNEYCGI